MKYFSDIKESVMTVDHRRALLENTGSEWKNVHLQPLLIPLKARAVLTDDEYEELKYMNRQKHKQKAYFHYLLVRKPDSAFDVLMSLMDPKQYHHICMSFLEFKQCNRLWAKIEENCE